MIFMEMLMIIQRKKMKKHLKTNHLKILMKLITIQLLNALSVEILASIAVEFVINLCAIYFVLCRTPGLTMKVTGFTSMAMLDVLGNSLNVLHVTTLLQHLVNFKHTC